MKLLLVLLCMCTRAIHAKYLRYNLQIYHKCGSITDLDDLQVRDATEVTQLPGWSGKLPTRSYAAYVTLNQSTEQNLFFWFFESQVLLTMVAVITVCTATMLIRNHCFGWTNLQRTKMIV